MSSSIVIVVITCVVSLIAFNNEHWMQQLRFNAYQINHSKNFYRFFSYGIVHADMLHLFVNMYVLYSFGPWVEYFFEQYFQEKATFFYLVLYVGAVFTSVIPSIEKHKNHPYYNAVGASGAISAVVFDYFINGSVLSPVQWISAAVMVFAIMRLNAEPEKMT